jgi:hypothetical protein
MQPKGASFKQIVKLNACLGHETSQPHNQHCSRKEQQLRGQRADKLAHHLPNHNVTDLGDWPSATKRLIGY